MRVRIAPGAVDCRNRSPTARAESAGSGATAARPTATGGSLLLMQYGRPRRHTRSPCRSMGVLFIGLDGTAFIRHVHATVAGYQVGGPERARNTSARPDWTRAAASSSSSLSGHCSSSFEQIGRCRLAAATDPNPRGRVTLRTIRRPGHGPSFDASRGNSVARQRLAIDLSGEDSLAGRFWWHRARRQRPLGPHRQQHCGHTHGSEQSHVEPRWFHCSMKSPLAAARTVCVRDGSVVHNAGVPSTADLRKRRNKVYSSLAPDVRQPACIQRRPVAGQRLGTPLTTRPGRARSLSYGCEGDRRGAHERDDQAARR